MALWMTLEEESAAINNLLATGRVAVDVLGESVQGRPIRLLRIGDPPPELTDRAVLMLVGGHHGDEPAGREACLNFAAYLATTTDPAELAFLRDHGVLIVPTINPDGLVAGTDENAAGINLNRDWILLSQPETRAVAPVLGAARPLIVVDHHEANGQVSDATFLWPTAPAVHEDIAAQGETIVTAMKARMASEGWTFANYNGGDRAHLLRNTVGLMYGAGILIETSKVDDTGSGRQHRVDVHYAMMEEALAYAIANADVLLAQAEAAAADKTAEGAAGNVPFDLAGLGGVVLDPPPLGYRLTGVLPTLHLQVFGVTVAHGVVSMAQAAQPVIPHLFDPAADDIVLPGVRLWTLPVPVVIATPRDIAPVVSGSHTLLTHVRLVTGFPTGYDPDGVDIPVRSGTVELDGTADVFATLDLEIPGVDPATGRPWFPRRSADMLAPYGAELFIRVGVDLGDRTLWSPLGYFRIDDLDQPDAPDGPIRISGSDRMAGIIDARLVEPMEFGRSATYAQVVTALVQDAHPLAVVAFDDDSGDRTIGRRLIVEEDRYEALRDLAESLGKLVRWDGEGILRVADAPDATVPVWHVRAGRHGVLVSAQRRVTRQGIYNAVVAQGEATSGAPARAVVVDDGPRSPTRWGGPFGKVPRFYSSPLLTTRGQARAAAASILRRSLGMPYSVSLGAVTNPALRPHDPIRVTLRDGSRDLHIVDTVSIPLTVGSGPMRLSTRSMADVRLGEL